MDGRGEDTNLGDVADNIHMTVNDMLLSLPGINIQNCRKVTDNVECIADLSTMSDKLFSQKRNAALGNVGNLLARRGACGAQSCIHVVVKHACGGTWGLDTPRH